MEKVVEKFKDVQWDRAIAKSKNISLMVSGVAFMVATVIFIFLTDFFLKNNAQWLFISALLGFGAGISAFFSEIKKENKILIYCLKGLALLLMVGFVVYLYKFMGSAIYTAVKEGDYIGMFTYRNEFGNPDSKIKINTMNGRNATMVLTFIFTYVGIAAQVFNITSNAIFGIEE